MFFFMFTLLNMRSLQFQMLNIKTVLLSKWRLMGEESVASQGSY